MGLFFCVIVVAVTEKFVESWCMSDMITEDLCFLIFCISVVLSRARRRIQGFGNGFIRKNEKTNKKAANPKVYGLFCFWLEPKL
ncbi:MAG TPA: hypothetical protein DCY07_01825 [Rhodospirillaceae bacterium]|nr:hypothetical protein [Rhodospirillaceae bacterium]